jgi:hypothetical protein
MPTDLPRPETNDERAHLAWHARNLAHHGKPLDEAWVRQFGPKIQELLVMSYRHQQSLPHAEE